MKARSFIKYAVISTYLAAAALNGGCGGGGGGSSRSDDLPVNDESPDNPPPARDPVPEDPPRADPGAPQAPQELTAASQSSGSIRVSWRDQSDDETGFILERSTVSADSGFDALVSLGKNTIEHTDMDGLAPSRTYWYRVMAERNGMQSEVSNTAEATTHAPPPAVPGAPTRLVATARSHSAIDLEWADNALTEIGFRIESAATSRGPFTEIAATGTNATSYRVKSLSPSRTYYFRVAAFNNAGRSIFSNTAEATTDAPPITVPTAPSNVTATDITESSARISWTDNADNESGFHIGRCTGLGGVDGNGNRWCASGFDTVATVRANGTAYVLSGLVPDTGYTFYVRAFNSAGNSQNREVAFRTDAGQQTTTLAPAYDNLVMISSQNPALATNVYQSGELAVGCNWTYSSFTGIQDYVCAQSLLQFDVSALSGAQIESAVLQLEVNYAGVGFSPRMWHLRALASAWSPATISWNGVQASNYFLASEQLFNPPATAGGIVQIDITAVVANWAGGTWANNGLIMGSADYTFPFLTSLDAFAFYSNETTGAGPQLVITYR